MNILKRALEWLRRLPMARYLKPLWKGALKSVVDMALAEAEREALSIGEHDGPEAVDRLLDAMQKEVKEKIKALPLPDGIEEKLAQIVQDRGDELQSRLKSVVAVQGPAAVKYAFYVVGQQIKDRIDRL